MDIADALLMIATGFGVTLGALALLWLAIERSIEDA